MKPYLLIFETQKQDNSLSSMLYSLFKDDTMINPFTFMFSSLEQLSKKLKSDRIKNCIKNDDMKFIITQISDQVLTRNCDNIQETLKEADIQVFPCL